MMWVVGPCMHACMERNMYGSQNMILDLWDQTQAIRLI